MPLSQYLFSCLLPDGNHRLICFLGKFKTKSINHYRTRLSYMQGNIQIKKIKFLGCVKTIEPAEIPAIQPVVQAA